MLLLELSIKRRWRAAGLRPLNIWLARVLTLSLLLAVADPVFFAPVETDSDLAMRVTEAVKDGYGALAAAAQLVMAAATSALTGRGPGQESEL